MSKHLIFAILMLGMSPFAIRTAEPAKVVFMIGEDEYHTWETLPEFARTEMATPDWKVTVIKADPADKNSFPGIAQALRDADLLLLSVRRRTPLKEQLDALRAYLAAGKPLVGIRTASHAFALRPKDKLSDPKFAVWQEFDPEVLGGHYTGHYGSGKVLVALAPGASEHPILRGVSVAKLIGNGGLYKVSPLAPAAVPLLIGTFEGQPAEPVAWTHLYGGQKARVFYTSLGHPDDFKNPEFRRLLLNAAGWALAR